jgi:hypothetical protein
VTTLTRLPHSWRVSRYEPALRARGSERESWTDHSDVGKCFNGITLTEEEYLRVENLYIDAVTRFAVDAAGDVFEVVYVGHQETGFGVSRGQTIPRSDLAPLVRGNLRGDLDCALQAAAGTCQIEFGFDLYIRVAAVNACERAVAETERAGLYVEPGVPLVLWES